MHPNIIKLDLTFCGSGRSLACHLVQVLRRQCLDEGACQASPRSPNPKYCDLYYVNERVLWKSQYLSTMASTTWD